MHSLPQPSSLTKIGLSYTSKRAAIDIKYAGLNVFKKARKDFSIPVVKVTYFTVVVRIHRERLVILSYNSSVLSLSLAHSSFGVLQQISPSISQENLNNYLCWRHKGLVFLCTQFFLLASPFCLSF